MPQVSFQPFRDRIEAGELLAARLSSYRDRDDVVVLALPRGGVPVAREVARALGVPFDVFVVRKLGVPGTRGTGHGRNRDRRRSPGQREVVDALGIPAKRDRRRCARANSSSWSAREAVYRGDRPPIAADEQDRASSWTTVSPRDRRCAPR